MGKAVLLEYTLNGKTEIKNLSAWAMDDRIPLGIAAISRRYRIAMEENLGNGYVLGFTDKKGNPIVNYLSDTRNELMYQMSMRRLV